MINWAITEDLPEWVSADPMNGDFSYGKTLVNLTFNSSSLTPGIYTHSLIITTNYGNQEIAVTLTKE